jgi:hydrogenase nickel incorporation protein HypA/HybF
MHEFSVASSLLRMVEGHARARAATRVVRVHVRIGAQAGVEPDLLCSAWQRVSERSAAAGAELVLHAVPLRWECRACATLLAPEAVPCCPACGGPASLASGFELVLERVEMEVADHV